MRIAANQFILAQNMISQRLYGVDSETMLVQRHRENGEIATIGYFRPSDGTFQPLPNWRLTYTKSLQRRCGLIDGAA